MTILRELAAWRERRAQRTDMNRRSIIQDECLLNIAAMCPTSVEEMRQIRCIRKDVSDGKLGREMLEVLENAKHIPQEQYVRLTREEKTPPYATALLEILKLLLKIKSAEHGVAPKLIASEEDLLHLIKGKNTPLLKGWRYDILGRDALGFCEGNLCIGFDKNKQQISISSCCNNDTLTNFNSETEN